MGKWKSEISVKKRDIKEEYTKRVSQLARREKPDEGAELRVERDLRA